MMKYRLESKVSKHVEPAHYHQGCCYGKVNSYLHTLRRKVPKELQVGDWFQVAVHTRSTGNGNSEFGSPNKNGCNSKDMDTIFQKLFKGWFKEGWVNLEKSQRGVVKRVVYSSECPFHVIVATSSIYRLDQNMHKFVHYWNALDVIQKDMGYKMKAWTQYAIAISLNGYGNDNNLSGLCQVGSNTGHMPVYSSHMSLEAIKFLQNSSANKFIKGRTKNSRNPKKTEGLTTTRKYANTLVTRLQYDGRNVSLTGCNPYEGNWLSSSARTVGAAETTGAYSNVKVNMKKFITDYVIVKKL
jgi:hypothetical protein